MRYISTGILVISLLGLSSAAFAQKNCSGSAPHELCGGPRNVYNFSTTPGWKVQFYKTSKSGGGVVEDVGEHTLATGTGTSASALPIRYCGERVSQVSRGKVRIRDPNNQILEVDFNQDTTGGCPKITSNCNYAIAFNKNASGDTFPGDLTIGPFSSFADAEKEKSVTARNNLKAWIDF